jgi:hypothetical protein
MGDNQNMKQTGIARRDVYVGERYSIILVLLIRGNIHIKTTVLVQWIFTAHTSNSLSFLQ